MKTSVRKIWNFSGSRDLSVYIFITGVTYFIMLAAFGAVIPVWWVNSISTILPFKVLYALFFINLIICEIKWIPVVIRKCRKPEMPETEEDLQRFRHRIEMRSAECGVRNVEKYLRRRGYKIQGSGEKNSSLLTPHSWPVLYAYKGRFSSIGNLLFHISFIFLLIGVFVSMNHRFDGKALLMEGQEYDSSPPEYGLTGLDRKGPEIKFTVVDIKPEFWKNEMLFTDLAAHVESGSGGDVARLSKAAYIDGSKVTITGISYTPKYVLSELGGMELDVGYVNLANFVSGTTDYFQIPGYPYKIYVAVYPDIEVKEGKLGTRSMNLKNPRLYIRVVRSKIPVYSGVLGLKEVAYFDGLALSFPEIKYNGSFRIIKDQGEIFIWTGFILMGIGLIWRLLFFRREVAVSVKGDDVYIHANCDYYPNLFIKKCVSVADHKE